MLKRYTKLVAITFCCLFVLNEAKGQSVYIPDANFVAWLNNNGYSACMSGNLMDTTCAAIVNTTAVECSSKGIQDLTGIQYFHNLQYLNCRNNNLQWLPVPLPGLLKSLLVDSNSLYSLPALPASDTFLSVGYNQLTSLPALPNSLLTLYCDSNHLDSLPVLPNGLLKLSCFFNRLTIIRALPTTLTFFNCQDNHLDSLPSLPAGLTYIDCGNNHITSLPALPAGLSTLFCNVNHLTGLPALPTGLSNLYCGVNQITSLPSLPSGLTILNCGYNLLTGLPSLPSGLFNLQCNGNYITGFPALPSSLYWMDCEFNSLTSLPALPPGLRTLWCNNNYLTSLPALPVYLFSLNCSNNLNLACLPQLTRIDDLNFSNTAVTCIPDYGSVTTSNPLLATVPLCTLFNLHGCGSFWNISGRIYYDADSSCTFNTGDMGQGYVKVQMDSAGIIQQQVFTGGEGFFSFQSSRYGKYKVTIDTSSLPFTLNGPSSGYYADSLSVTDSLVYNNDFALKCRTQGFDIGVQSVINNNVIPRPASIIRVNTIAGDISSFYGAHCAAGTGGQVQIVYTGQIHYMAPAFGALTPTAVSGDTITWNIADFGNVNPYTAFNLSFLVDSYATAGAPVCINVTVTPTTGDYNPSNNNYNYCFSIVNAMDPNEKEVYPKGSVNAGDWLTYTIRFQNTGTAPAVNIYVKDTLSSYLDPSTFQLLTYSAENLTQIFGNVVVFNFPNINLADSATSQLLSTGYVQFRIKAKNNMLTGSINNAASIYFDLNPPVVTNTVFNTLCANVYTNLIDTIACGDSIAFGSNTYHIGGTYTDTLLTGLGCDSIVILHLFAIGDTVNVFGGLCAGDSFYFYGHWIYHPGGFDTILPGHGTCDTMASIFLAVLDPLPPHYATDTICASDSLYFAGVYLRTSGVYSHLHCDSSVILTLTVLNLDTVSIARSICAGDTFRIGAVAYTQSGYYFDTLTNGNGCDSIVTLALTVNNPPNITFDTVWSYQGLTVITVIPSNALSYQWQGSWDSTQLVNIDTISLNSDSLTIFCGGLIMWHVFPAAFVRVILTLPDGCIDTSGWIQIWNCIGGINEINADNSISIYPNPASTELYIKAENFRPEQLTLYDISGQVLQSGKFEPHIDVSQLSSGVYFIEVKAGSEVARKRFVKM